MLRIALTGGIACGKSLVGSILAKLGAEICETDQLAHELMAPGSSAHEEIVAAFGLDILDGRGFVDRRSLGRRVFGSSKELAHLNALVHPHVKRKWRTWLETRAAGTDVAVVIIPLLYEIGAEAGWDSVVCVGASRTAQLARLRRRKLFHVEADRRISSQMPVAEKVARADFVIMSEGDKRVLEEQTVRVWKRILACQK